MSSAKYNNNNNNTHGGRLYYVLRLEEFSGRYETIPSVTILWDSFIFFLPGRSERCASCHVILKERERGRT